MVKKVSDNQGVSAAVQVSVQYYSDLLSSYIDKKRLFELCRTHPRSMRLYLYESLLGDACSKCFRGTNICERGTSYSCDVWGFRGGVWERVSSLVFSSAVGSALIGCSGAGSLVVTDDWVSKKGQLLSCAYGGVCSSPLELSASVIGFSNGVWDFIDLDHPVSLPLSSRPCVTSVLSYGYDAGAGCPRWLSFLEMMLCHRDVIRLQKYLGLGVVRRSSIGRSIEDTLWLIGSGANGKSTIAKVLSLVYGDSRVSWLSMRELLDRNPMSRQLTLGRLDGKLFNICEESDMDDISRESDAFKKLCSGSPQSARDIGKNVREVKDIPFLIFMMNSRPSNKRMDAAFRRRIVEIDFKVSVKEEDMDTDLLNKFVAELPGIRNWMMDGYRLLRSDGFLFDHSSSEEYMEENGQLFDLFARHEGLRPSGWAGHGERPQLVSAQVLLERFDDFCQRKHLSSEHPTPRSMSCDLKRLHFSKARRKSSGVYYEVYCDRVLDYSV